MNSLLSTAYWPNLHYFYYVLNSENVWLEQFENYQKQSYRNRTQILSANGVLDLVIPVRKKALKELSKDVEIAYQDHWQMKHWRAITSAYKNSPYFEHFETEIETFYKERYEFLLDYNLAQLKLLLKLLKKPKEIQLSLSYEKIPQHFYDFREIIHPKRHYGEDKKIIDVLGASYYQTFENKFDFHSNLSMLDLLFNKGLGALEYLKQ